MGRLVLGLPWEQITEDYEVTRGGFLGVGLLFMAAAPRLAAWTGAFLSAPGATALPQLTAAIGRWRDALGLEDVPVPSYPALPT